MSGTQRWIFGYGSLVWRPAFAFLERAPGYIHGFERRFWQGSPDHRGRTEAPGCVATLVPVSGARCWGMAYRVAEEVWPRVLEGLDDRESGGFARHEVTVRFDDDSRGRTQALVYVAGEANPNFLGPLAAEAIARRVRSCRGKSGTNTEYVLRLADSLREHGIDDEHVMQIAALLRAGDQEAST